MIAKIPIKSRTSILMFAYILFLVPPVTFCQDTLEQRQPLELVFADSIVPQDRHEAMLTTGFWYSRRDTQRKTSLAQKIEWGLSDKLQVSILAQLLNGSKETTRMRHGIGDLEVGARYTWAKVGSEYTHVALAFDAGFPTGNVEHGLSEGNYTLSPSVLISRELRAGKYHVFATTGWEFITKRRHTSQFEKVSRDSFFSNGGISFHSGRGWSVCEVSLSSDRWSGGDETKIILTPSYVWRYARRGELLFGIPIGLTSSSQHIGAVVKFTFELGGKRE
jgi:hypothetical protein